MGDPLISILDNPSSEQLANSLFDAHLGMRIMMFPGEVHGSTPVTGTGMLVPVDLKHWYSTMTGNIGEMVMGAGTSSATEVMLLNELVLAPKHGPLSVRGIYGKLSIGIGCGGSSTNMFITGIELALVKISAAGTETVLSTNRRNYANSTASTVTVVYNIGFAFTYPAAYAFAEGERLAYRVRSYGYRTGVYNSGHILNVDTGIGVPNSTGVYSSTSTGVNQSIICLRLE